MKKSNEGPVRKFLIRIFRKICKIPVIASQIGFFRIMQVGYIYFFEPQIMKVRYIYANLAIKPRRIWKKLNAKRDLASWSLRKSELISNRKNTISIAELGIDENGLKSVKEKLKNTKQVVIAKIDQDGFYHSYFGLINGLPCVNESNFLPRIRFSLYLVTIDEIVGVKKDYCNCASSFLSEIKTLDSLTRAGCNVPSILDVDFENYSLTISFIPGTVLREELASKGAVLRDRDVEKNPKFVQLTPEASWLKRIDEGKRYLRDVVNEDFIEKLFDQILKIHSAGFLINDIKYGNVISERKTGNPFLVDFESSDNLTGLGHSTFRALIDNDIKKFNLHFGTNKPTYYSLKRRIDNKEYPFPDKWYSPSYFDAGLRVGALWNPDVGWGRWHYILKDNLPNLKGKRVLDLGANNGFNSLQILRSGAREVIGFEIDPIAIEQGIFLKSVVEWLDMRKFNFRYVQSSMADLISMDLGNFDLVIALCSIYYLDDKEITDIIRHISLITDCFIVQCNITTDIGRGNPHTYEKSSVEFLKSALETNGFPEVKVIAPKHYSRPLLIGRKTEHHDP